MSSANITKWVRNVGLSWKFNAVVALSLGVFAWFTATVILGSQRSALEDTLATSVSIVEAISEEEVRLTQEGIRFKAGQLARLLSAIAPQPMVEFDLSLLGQFADMAVDDPDISFVSFRNPDGRPFAVAGDETAAEVVVDREVVHEDVALGSVKVGYHLRRAAELSSRLQAERDKNITEMRAANEQAVTEAFWQVLAVFVIGGLATATVLLVMVRRLISRPLNKVVSAANRLADGDLTGRVDHRSGDEIGRLAVAFNEMADKFRQMLHQVMETTTHLSTSSEHMSTITEQTKQGVVQQQRETDLVATAMNEMTATVHEVAKNAANAAEYAEQASREAISGSEVVSETIVAINALAKEVEHSAEVIQELEAHSADIGRVVEVINSVAEQTNLLALNAAIEAARAGEQGRGFAVVADEVRTLARRTQESTEEIRNLIERVQLAATQAAKVMEEGRSQARASVDQASKAGISLETITQAVSSINDMNAQIASAAEEQSSVAEEMNRNIVSISNVSNETADGAEETAREGEALAQLAQELSHVVRRFQL